MSARRSIARWALPTAAAAAVGLFATQAEALFGADCPAHPLTPDCCPSPCHVMDIEEIGSLGTIAGQLQGLTTSLQSVGSNAQTLSVALGRPTAYAINGTTRTAESVANQAAAWTSGTGAPSASAFEYLNQGLTSDQDGNTVSGGNRMTFPLASQALTELPPAAEDDLQTLAPGNGRLPAGGLHASSIRAALAESTISEEAGDSHLAELAPLSLSGTVLPPIGAQQVLQWIPVVNAPIVSALGATLGQCRNDLSQVLDLLNAQSIVNDLERATTGYQPFFQEGQRVAAQIATLQSGLVASLTATFANPAAAAAAIEGYAAVRDHTNWDDSATKVASVAAATQAAQQILTANPAAFGKLVPQDNACPSWRSNSDCSPPSGPDVQAQLSTLLMQVKYQNWLAPMIASARQAIADLTASQQSVTSEYGSNLGSTKLSQLVGQARASLSACIPTSFAPVLAAAQANPGNSYIEATSFGVFP